MYHDYHRTGDGWGRGMVLLHDPGFARLGGWHRDFGALVTRTRRAPHPGGSAGGPGWLAGALGAARAVLARIRRHQRWRATLRDLRRMSDGALADIGLRREQLPEFAAALTARAPTPAPSAPTMAPIIELAPAGAPGAASTWRVAA